MKVISTRKSLIKIAKQLKERGRMPRNLEFTEVAGFHLVNSFDELNASVIHESVTTGFDLNQDLAALKSLVEFCERRAFDEASDRKDPSCKTERSDGLAAFPVGTDPLSAKTKARENAYFEAVERYVWANWWDHSDIGFDTIPASSVTELAPILNEIEKWTPVEKSFVIKPHLENQDLTVSIVICFLKDGGVISGGACGKSQHQGQIILRASAELLRHSLAVSRMKNQKITPTSFYERRLHYFAGPEGEALVKHRLSQGGQARIALPRLSIDSKVDYALSDLVHVHRCLFENQPPFVGGALERFCI